MYFSQYRAPTDEVTITNASGSLAVIEGGFSGIPMSALAESVPQLVGTVVATGGESSLGFTGLDSTACNGYLIFGTVDIASVTGGSQIRLFANGDTTEANYTRGTVTVNGQNDADIADNNDQAVHFMGYVFVDMDGLYRYVGICNQADSQACQVYGVKSDSALASNTLTALAISPSGASPSFAAGSQLTLYQL